ncbi:hypothetical protein BD324DRAFT_612110 [Kockovaella imperatae]|uniref:Protein YIP n=1 Tax=Kockovaella imperatae TaxID=4999 RepID=A0A1Y1UT29_9TREE|nr:hypothetical protein BD324DRAFT_612110 [Kockovaella imperatae]ORX40787.1 hypothetical protein BD324DRAFT_612110 [Kockovaella imperatae]
MANQGGYAVVDADEDDGQGGRAPGLEFKTFLGTESAQERMPSASTSSGRTPAEVPYSPFNLVYYQGYFDVETTTILKRVGMSMIPREGFIQEVCDGHIDLYGPFWTLTTLILTLYTTSTLTASISQYLSNPDLKPESNIPLLTTATSLLYIYGLGVPALLWAATKWLGVGDWGLAEALGIYGYAMGVYVPISLLCLIPVGILRWVLVGLGAVSSGYFMVRNIYPVLANADNKMLRLLIVAVAVLHGVMALAMKVLFFSYSVAGYNVGPDPIATNPILTAPTDTSDGYRL